MRFLLEPCNNTLSHIGKCLAVREHLLRRGHEVAIAAAPSRDHFLEQLGIPHVLLADIQEVDGSPLPTFHWFRPARVESCIRAEVELIQELRPDAVLGVFRFTGALSAAIAGVPYDSLICGSMTPACEEVLGFAEHEPGAQEQADSMAFFRQAGARRMNPALANLGLEPIEDLWQLLLGRRTFLWDFPEFQSLSPLPGLHHVGPVIWSDWPCSGFDPQAFDALAEPIAVISFGTGATREVETTKSIEVLHRLGFSVVVSTNGPLAPHSPLRSGPGLAPFDFLPLPSVLPRTSLLVCHGGQGIIFEALAHEIPVLVLPFQPEQAHNGLCLERMGCGLRLERGTVFRGASTPRSGTFLEKTLGELETEIGAFLSDPAMPKRLKQAAEVVRSYDGARAVASLMEGKK
jgi:UDP:flavonoid glycosyltransferase YjiC (YdhE family)